MLTLTCTYLMWMATYMAQLHPILGVCLWPSFAPLDTDGLVFRFISTSEKSDGRMKTGRLGKDDYEWVGCLSCGNCPLTWHLTTRYEIIRLTAFVSIRLTIQRPLSLKASLVNQLAIMRVFSSLVGVSLAASEINISLDRDFVDLVRAALYSSNRVFPRRQQ